MSGRTVDLPLRLMSVKHARKTLRTPTVKSMFWACFMALCLLSTPPVSSQPRDGGLADSAADAAVTRCNSDPECRREVAKELQRQAAAQAEYDAKPLHEKAIPWLVIAAIGWGIWVWIGKR
jgi:hypothetical protein